jgi:hypothetical protein
MVEEVSISQAGLQADTACLQDTLLRKKEESLDFVHLWQ